MELRVLIVDDSPAMRGFIRRVLDISGVKVQECLEAASGEEALALLETNWIDLILTDLNMPGMGGEELLRRIKEHETFRLIPVMVVSTDKTPGRMAKMIQLGAKGYLTKPFAPETLRQGLEEGLGGGSDEVG
jgi:two-component system chemotaxis response regulator CheY